MGRNVYAPHLARIKSVREEAEGIKSFKLEFEDSKIGGLFDYCPGQFIELTVFGVGEAPFSITSSPVNKGYLEISVAAVGEVTRALHLKKEEELVGIRGPYGNGFPFDEATDRDILVIGGGIGLAPLRSLINQIFAYRDSFHKMTIIHGAETLQRLCFRDELKMWGKKKNCKVLVGVRNSLPKVGIDVRRTAAFISGPPIMAQFAIQDLLKRGVEEDKIIISMERRMECGLGKCGHCNIGRAHVCLDGPVFRYRQLRELEENI